ncbi:MAG: ABC transporter ATP-binding protein/permease [[Lactobacillus] timonensis]|jgi:ATP-binding cassette subfamily B protein|nr:ABC transporter ATP-binding protein [[Lactobacillus] timonensis]MCI1926462.1 ABC transporter ATP-binding protein/permease [[Lactobacillus] timonensis]MCI1957863.1 ABC transporter ATP-binding protein/permease [[Lactobacillus] timonensis]
MAVMRHETKKAQHFWPSTKRLLMYLRPWWGGVLLSVILAIASVLFSIIAPKVLGDATTTIYNGIMKGYRMMQAGQTVHQLPIDFHRIGRIALVVVLLYSVSGLLSLAEQVMMTWISQKVVFTLRQDLKAKMARVPVRFYDTHSNGDLMSRMVNDMDNIAGTLQSSLIELLTSALTFVGVLALMFSISWQLTLVALITVPLSLVIVAFVAPTAQRLFTRQQDVLGNINAQVEETYAGHTIVRTFNHEEDEEQRFRQVNHHYYQAAWKAQFFSILIWPLMNFVRSLGYLMVAVVGAIRMIHGQITIGNIQAFLQYVNQFSQPITQVANLSSTLQQTIASAERIFEILDEPEMTTERTNFPVKKGRSLPKIEFDHVNFSYGQEPLVKDFNLKAPANHMVAIVGPTGAGKSTIINLLERFYDIDGGHIYLDGQDTRNMSRHELRSHIAMVLQETWLFSGTIFENIKYGRDDATDEEVYAAAKIAYAYDFIQDLPQGFETKLDEAASNISQGQRQLLTIARAFLADPDILILDEATSSVDTRTESLIQRAMDKLQHDRTSFVVAHRLSTIRNAERIIVMNHGDIIETGDHESLMAKNGFYADLYNSQFIGNAL